MYTWVCVYVCTCACADWIFCGYWQCKNIYLFPPKMPQRPKLKTIKSDQKHGHKYIVSPLHLLWCIMYFEMARAKWPGIEPLVYPYIKNTGNFFWLYSFYIDFFSSSRPYILKWSRPATSNQIYLNEYGYEWPRQTLAK